MTTSTSTSTSIPQPIINITISDSFDSAKQNELSEFYNLQNIERILSATLSSMDAQQDIDYPNFTEIDVDVWQHKPKELDIYITDTIEGHALNLDARGKDYATNILSYPSELPPFIISEIPTLPLGELIICHDVVITQANEQNKTVANHAQHLLVHGILHLLGFDHELGDDEADEMEGFEIAILQDLGVDNPYKLD